MPKFLNAWAMAVATAALRVAVCRSLNPVSAELDWSSEPLDPESVLGELVLGANSFPEASWGAGPPEDLGEPVP